MLEKQSRFNKPSKCLVRLFKYVIDYLNGVCLFKSLETGPVNV